MQGSHLSLAAAGTLIVSSSSLAAIEVLFSDIPAHPTALVPAGTGLPATAEFELFDRPFRSPNGQRWIMQAQVAPPILDTEDRIVMVYDGTTWGTVLREGQAAPWAPAENMGFFDVAMGINDSGQFAFGNDTSGATTSDLYVVGFDGANYVIVAQEGQPVPAGGGNFGATQGSMHILADGTVGFDTTASAGGSRLMHGASVVGQSTVTILSNQPLAQTQTFSSLTSGWFFSSADGSNTFFRCNLNGDTTVDEIIAVNGRVVLHEGQVIVGMDNPITTTYVFGNMLSNGDWFVRGATATDAEDYIVRNGTLIARTGAAITPGNTELYDDASFAACFYWQHGNNNGDWVVGGVTNAADVNANAVLVLNGTDVVAREGDVVDLNGNGLPDDDAFLSVFNNDDGFLTDDLLLYFTADLRDGAGTALGQALLRLDVAPTPDCLADIVTAGASAGVVDIDDLLAVISAWGPCADPNNCPADISPKGGDDVVDIDDLLAVISAWGPCP